jgi:predicted RNA-binding protein Jag
MRNVAPLQEIPALAKKWCACLGFEIDAVFEQSGDEELFPNRASLAGPDASRLLAGKSQPLDALQYLLHEAQGERDESKLVYLDVQGNRLFRMQELVAMANIAAQKARQTGSYVFASLTPKERRWVHLTIDRESDLSTCSEGFGATKALRVFRKVDDSGSL